MSIESIAAIIFIFLMAAFLFFQRKKVKIQKIVFPLLYFVMYRSKLGLVLMDKISSRHKKLLRILAPVSIVSGFLGMALISYALIDNVILLFTRPEAVSGVGIVLPIRAKGVFFVPFFFWIISIFIIAVVHEFSHGVFARFYNMEVKSSGLAFLNILVPVVPAAFVEPNEEEITKRSCKEQLAVYSAGPFANFIAALVVFGLISLVFGPLLMKAVVADGVQVTGFADGNFSVKESGMREGELIVSVDSAETDYVSNFSGILAGKRPGDIVEIKTNASSYNVSLAQHPSNSSRSYMGVYIQQHSSISEGFKRRYGEGMANFLIWFSELLFFLYMLNLGIGLFNLAPMGPLDGGRMALALLGKFLDKERARIWWKRIGMFFFLVVLITVVMAFVR